MSEFMIREITTDDLNEIAAIHKASFDDRALSQLGISAIKRYYLWLLTGFPENYPICGVSEDGQIAGFCFTGSYSGSFSGFLIHNRGFLIAKILMRPWLIFNPIIREQSALAIKTLRSQIKIKNKNSQSPPKTDQKKQKTQKNFGILAIAVNPKFQRQGVGKYLMDAAEARAIEDGYTKMHLSVHPSNKSAIRFYENLGWQKMLSQGTWDGKMFKNLE